MIMLTLLRTVQREGVKWVLLIAVVQPVTVLSKLEVSSIKKRVVSC